LFLSTFSNDFPQEKPVTIVQGSDALLNPTYPSNFRDQMFKEISSRGVNVLFNEVLDNVPTDGRTLEGIKTRSGKFIDADLVIPTRGGRPNTAFLADSGVPLSVSGHIRTEPTLQVKGFPDIFAAGDVLDWAEQKQCAKYPAHAEVVAANVLERLKDHQPSVHYKGSHEIALIVNGRVRTHVFCWHLPK
jgi:apoptosis-inducing factor 2